MTYVNMKCTLTPCDYPLYFLSSLVCTLVSSFLHVYATTFFLKNLFLVFDIVGSIR